MGLFDLPAPVFGVIDDVLAFVLPSFLRLCVWGIFAGLLTMLLYRRLSNQEKIGLLKSEQKEAQKDIAAFDGEFDELMPMIRKTLGLGFRQLGLALGPALLASLPIIFVIIWVAGQFGYSSPAPGETVHITASPARSGQSLRWTPAEGVTDSEEGWHVSWPASGQTVQLAQGDQPLLSLPLPAEVPVIHKKQWWNSLMANPIGYLPDTVDTDLITIGLPPQTIIPFGPGWMQGWMFTFFMVFLISSLGFKFILRID
jgi:hypothetical protein